MKFPLLVEMFGIGFQVYESPVAEVCFSLNVKPLNSVDVIFWPGLYNCFMTGQRFSCSVNFGQHFGAKIFCV